MDLLDLGALPDFDANPYAVYAKLREQGPVHRVRGPLGHEFWLIVGHEEGRAALADPRLSKNAAVVGAEIGDDYLIGPTLLDVDPPDHTRLRKLVAREFTMRRVEQLGPRIQEIADGLLDAMAPAGRADLVDAFAFPLPIIVICELLGIPAEDRDAFRAWSNEVVAPSGLQESERAFVALGAYLDGLIEDKRSRGPSGDLLSALLDAQAEDGDRLSVRELRSLGYLLLVAGHETTVNLITNAVRALLAHPGQLAALRADFSLLDGAIEETLRYTGPVDTATPRYTGAPFEIGGTVIPAGEMVIVGLGAGGRDPGRHPAPDVFDITRDARGHLGFGHGIHFCLGAPLARLEVRIALRSLLTRCPELAADPGAGPLQWLPGMLMHGVRAFPVRW